ncbi:MAG: SMI1/KNR4 family protein [Minicystis sp.]
MRWVDLIQKSYADGEHEGRPALSEGATVQRIAWLESQLSLRIPSPLRDLLQETDGVGQMAISYGKWERVHTEVWSSEKIAEENLRIRADRDMPPLPPPGAPEAVPLYFANAGADGILFAFLVRPLGPEDPAVYAYYPMDGEWRLISPTLEAHLRGWTV